MGYDVIVVGARAAGATTAMLLARQGLRVLVVDRARFPSDTLSTHQVQVPGVARLHRWGLLDGVRKAGTPATRRVRLDAGHTVLDGHFPAYQGVDVLYSPRRTVLDALLVEAARAAGAEVREGFVVEQVVGDGDRVTGIRGFERGRPPVTERAQLVVGADGKRSRVAAAVGARRYRERAARSFACYTYWSGVPMSSGELYQRPGRAVAAFPTNGGLVMVYTAAPIAEFADFRADVDTHYRGTLDLCGDLGDRVREGVRAERFRATPDLPNLFRVPCGPGWALVGDAGVVMDPVTAQGIANAFRDAELLADAVASATGASAGGASAGGAGPARLDRALTGYWRQRDKAVRPMYDFTVRLAGLEPMGWVERRLLASIVDRPEEVDRFLGAFGGVVPLREYRRGLVRRLAKCQR
jgi:2-polyprenyl-6-methoxyphenol hydroxylase-like FAD-dependent oxidoreductase